MKTEKTDERRTQVMKTEKYNYAERLALYIAQRSVGKSIPLVVHKVPKPENLAKMLEKISEE